MDVKIILLLSYLPFWVVLAVYVAHIIFLLVNTDLEPFLSQKQKFFKKIEKLMLSQLHFCL